MPVRRLQLLLLAGCAAALNAPPLSSLTGTAQAPSALPRDLPVLTNFFGSAGSANDVVGLSQVLLPPYLDAGLPTAELRYASAATPCAPDTMGAYLLVGAGDTALQTFVLTSASPSLRTYSLTCAGPDCTSWRAANASSAAPFTAFAIDYHELPPRPAFSDVGAFSRGCARVDFARSAGAWCAASAPAAQCASASDGVPLEGWQWAPTAVLRWGGPARTETRMGFEANLVLQTLALQAPPGAPLPPLTLSLAPLFRAYPRALGWTTAYPRSAAGYTCALLPGGAGVSACDGASPACAVWLLAAQALPPGAPPLALALPNGTCAAQLAFSALPPGGAAQVSLVLAIAPTAAAAVALAQASAFAPAWAAAAARWEARWQGAFGGAGGEAGHYSGALPVLALEASPAGARLQRMYYMAAYAVLAHERTNLPLVFPRVYLTGAGNQFAGYSIGGTMQFAWDQTFYAALFALLDPAAARADLARWIGQPIASHFGIELDSGAAGGDFYAFNALSLYRAFSSYLRVTGEDPGSDFSRAALPYMALLRDFWQAYAPAGSFLADYSGDPNNYLECLPTYRHATAALQAGASYMSLDYAELLEARGNASGAAALRARAQGIAAETLAAMYVARTASARVNGSAPGDVGGWWRALDVRGGGRDTAEVRHVVDFAYAAMGFANPRWPAQRALNASTSAQMRDFALRQLAVPGGAWMRALSPLDGAAPVARPDHGSTGAYDAWPAMSADALAALDGGFAAALPFLVGVAGAAEEGPYGQAHGVDDGGGRVFKTSEGWTRYQANNGAAFGETVLGVLFGYSPGYSGAGAPLLAGADRGVAGVLACIRGPGGAGFATATLSPAGVAYTWAPSC